MHTYFTHCPAWLKKSNKVHTLNSTARQESKTVYTVNCPVSRQAAKKKNTRLIYKKFSPPALFSRAKISKIRNANDPKQKQ